MQPHLSTVYLGLGANLGDRRAMLRGAVDALRHLPALRITQISTIYESAPWDLTEQPNYLNIVVEVETALKPLELLTAVKAVETRLGRKPTRRWGPRCIDIDLILWGAVTLRTEDLVLPHKRFRDRAFVLMPLAEIAPNVVDPETGATISALLRRVEPGAITRYPGTVYS